MRPLLTAVATAIAMEPVSAAVHRYVGHGPAWGLHRSHHEQPTSGPEPNDLIPAASALATIGLFALDRSDVGPSVAGSIATGMTAYGALYFVVHDLYVHRRLPLLPRRVGLLEPLRLAHLEHHRTGTGNWGLLSGGLRPGRFSRS